MLTSRKLFILISIISLIVFTIPLQASITRRLDYDTTASISLEERFALVIGNSKYEISPLLNPVKDARDVSKVLQDCGFKVTQRENLSLIDLKKEVREFSRKLKQGDIALFYYAGHGVQVHGRNYLIPIDASIESEEQVEYESVEVGWILSEIIASRTRLNIIVLDACRNNPFAANFRSPDRGLAIMRAPSGTIIAYATSPGSVASDGTGKNGLYTQEFLTKVTIPGLRIEDVFKQIRTAVRLKSGGKQLPWENSSLEDDFYFKEALNSSNREKTESNTDVSTPPGSVRGALWFAESEAIRMDVNGKPTFYEFIQGGKVKLRTVDNDWEQLRDDLYWYQIGDTVYLLAYDFPSKKDVIRRYKGIIKNNSIEGLGSNAQTGETYPWKLRKVIQ